MECEENVIYYKTKIYSWDHTSRNWYEYYKENNIMIRRCK